MSNTKFLMKKKKNIALIAHDERKQDLLDWVKFNKGTLSEHNLFGTGSTGKLIGTKLGLKVETYLSGPLGGDQQIGAKITDLFSGNFSFFRSTFWLGKSFGNTGRIGPTNLVFLR